VGEKKPLIFTHNGKDYVMGTVEISDDGNDVYAVIYDQGVPVEETEPEK